MKKTLLLGLLLVSANFFAQDQIVSELQFLGLKKTKESFLNIRNYP